MEIPTILIFEDNPIHLEYVKLSLEECHYKIVGFSQFTENVHSIIDIHKPNVVLIDIDLGNGDDGILLSKIIRQKFSTPIIFLTSKSEVNTMKEAFESKPISYLVKPVSQSNLISALELALFSQQNETYENVEDDLISKMNTIINENLSSPTFSIDFLAEEMGMSSRNLARIVKSKVGITPKKYVKEIQLKTANRLLNSSSKNIDMKDVAEMVGYTDTTYFKKIYTLRFNDTLS